MITYHLIACPRYRRKIFLIDGVEDTFKQEVYNICRKNNFEVLALECNKDHFHLFVQVDPTWSAAKVVKTIKVNTARIILQQFKDVLKGPTLWTRSYFESTAGAVSAKTIEKYINMQKKRN